MTPLRAGNMPPRSLAPASSASKTAPAAHESVVVGLGAAQPIAFNARHTCTCTAFGRDGSVRISRLRVSIERTLHACSNHFNYGGAGAWGGGWWTPAHHRGTEQTVPVGALGGEPSALEVGDFTTGSTENN